MTHYDPDDIEALASEPNEIGARIAEVKLEPGDTAFAPGTTKYHLLAHGRGGTVTYVISREGWNGFIDGQVARSLIR